MPRPPQEAPNELRVGRDRRRLIQACRDFEWGVAARNSRLAIGVGPAAAPPPARASSVSAARGSFVYTYSPCAGQQKSLRVN